MNAQISAPEFNQRAQGFFRWQVVDAATKEVVCESPGWIKNLILNNGMDRVSISPWCDLFTYGVAGTGTTPTSDDSGVTTAAQVGTAVTLTGGSFVFTSTIVDAGNVIKWDTGEEATISTVVSPTSVIVTNSVSVTGAEFTVYNTNQTGLVSEVKRSNTYLTGTPYCGTTIVGNVLEHRRTYDFTAEGGGTVNYTEVGVSWAAAGASTLFSRILLPGPVPVLNGQQLRLVYQLNVTLAPSASAPKTAIINGWPVSPAVTTDGDEQLQAYAVSTVSTLGLIQGIYGHYGNEPSTGSTIGVYLSTDASAPAAFGVGSTRSANVAYTNMGKLSYTTGSYYQDKSATFAVGNGNRSDWNSMGFGAHSPNLYFCYQQANNAYVFVFDEAQTKANTHTLTLNFRWSWSRVLA